MGDIEFDEWEIKTDNDHYICKRRPCGCKNIWFGIAREGDEPDQIIELTPVDVANVIALLRGKPIKRR
jgi:hypothetical protein